jgi:hypothetical protein
MEIIKLSVSGQTPSKKNSKQIVFVKGRPLIISSKNYQEWHKISLKTLKMTPIRAENIEKVVLYIYGKDKRKWDLTNRAESIMDLMVDAGIIEDDNYSIVPKITLIYGGIDKENPRCDIEIYVGKT